MPVEIRELVIRTVIDKDTGGTSDRETGGSASTALQDPGVTEAIVQACVRQVMQILARNEER